MLFWAFLFAVSIAPAIANPIAEPKANERPQPCKNVLNCLYKYGGESFVTSYCSTNRITKTVTSTEYENTVTDITATRTKTASTVTATNTDTDFVSVPETTVTVSTEYTGTITITNTVATVTDTATDTATAFTCDGTPRPPSATPVPLPSPISTLVKRQTTNTATLDFATIDTAASSGTSTDTAAPAFTCSALYGSEGIKAACRCPRVPKATVTTTTTLDATTIRTSTITKTPTVTASTRTTITTSVSISVTATTISTLTSNATSTTTTTTATTLTSPSAAPTSFLLTLNNTSDTPLLGYRALSPASAGTLIAFAASTSQNNATTFSLNAAKQLTASDGDKVLVVSKNARDPFPYLFLDAEGSAPAGLTPYCSACNGTVRCEFETTRGEAGSAFALCDGFLALGILPGEGGVCRGVEVGYQVLRG